MADETLIEPKPGIIMDMNPEDEIVRLDIDIDGDGQSDIHGNLIIHDKRIWAIVSIIIFIIAGSKVAGIW